MGMAVSVEWLDPVVRICLRPADRISLGDRDPGWTERLDFLDPSIGEHAPDLDFAPIHDLNGGHMEGSYLRGWTRPTMKQKKRRPCGRRLGGAGDGIRTRDP